ncbi:acyl-CoA thioester hydrolase/BAAT C-terminal domain-containing protein [Propionibacteriaceae bacterium Y1685]
MSPRGKRIGKIIGLGALALILLVALVGVVLVITKPWAPQIEVSDPGPTGERITDDGLLANLYPGTSGAGILLLGGSEGGISAGVHRQALSLQEAGFTVLAQSYWGGEGQSPRMENLPLEAFDTALARLRRAPEVDPDRIAVVGGSKGAEAALLIATRDPELRAVVAAMPSNVAWAGIDLAEIWRMPTIGSTWSVNGAPLPYLPYASTQGGDTVDMYAASLDTLGDHPDAVIPIERAKASILLPCGGADTLWPSCRMATAVADRAEHTANKGQDAPSVEVLEEPKAGHMAMGPPYSGNDDLLTRYGGTAADNRAAQERLWARTLAFLTEYTHP